MSDRLLGAVLVALSATAFGSMAIFGVWAQDDGTSTPALVFVRFASAAAILTVVMQVRRIAWPSRRDCLRLAAMGGIGYVGQAYCYFLALEHAQASLVSLLLYLFPAFVAVLAAVFLHERLNAVTAAAMGLAFAGTFLVVGGGSGRPLGVALAIGAAVIYSVYVTAGSVVTKGLDPVAASTIVCASAGVVGGLIVLVLAGVGRPASFPHGGNGWASLAAMSVICTVFAILMFFAGLSRLGPTPTSVLSTLEPVVTVVLATAFLGEVLGTVQLIGGALVLVAVVWLAAGQRRPTRTEVPPV